jgi:ATP-binding cassette subfamily B (MDR/TAP) protein 1
MPSFVFLIGNILDSFNSTTDPDVMLSNIKRLSGIFGLIGIFLWITTYINFAFLYIFSERVAKKTRVKYLEAILKQEASWFDLTNP